MAKLYHGPATRRILESSGPERASMQFYSTTYSTNYRAGRKNGPYGSSSQTRQKGTGYLANFRPVMQYSAQADTIDNPSMKTLLEDNYVSHTKMEFFSHKAPHSDDLLPRNVAPCISGYAHNGPRTLPTKKQVNEVHIDTREVPGPITVFPRHKPVLTMSRRTTDPIDRENAGHGPSAMTSEVKTQFIKKEFRNSSVRRSGASCKEESGFTLAQSTDPVTFKPHESYSNEVPGYLTWRPTGCSLMQQSYRSPAYSDGTDPLHSVNRRASHGNGYIKGSKYERDIRPRIYEKVGYTELHQVHPIIQKNVHTRDPAEFTNMTHPTPTCTLTQRHFGGQQRPSLSESRTLCREAVGLKTTSGYVDNTIPFVEPRDRDVVRFESHYQNRFADPNDPKSTKVYGWSPVERTGVRPPGKDGYSKSTLVHKYVPPPNQTLPTMDPYTARVVLKVDPTFSDYTHGHKDRTVAV